jgi:hypothetical protein
MALKGLKLRKKSARFSDFLLTSNVTFQPTLTLLNVFIDLTRKKTPDNEQCRRIFPSKYNAPFTVLMDASIVRLCQKFYRKPITVRWKNP